MTILTINSSGKTKNDDVPFKTIAEVWVETVAYEFLILFILMAAVNIALLLSIRTMNKNNSSRGIYLFRKE